MPCLSSFTPLSVSPSLCCLDYLCVSFLSLSSTQILDEGSPQTVRIVRSDPLFARAILRHFYAHDPDRFSHVLLETCLFESHYDAEQTLHFLDSVLRTHIQPSVWGDGERAGEGEGEGEGLGETACLDLLSRAVLCLQMGRLQESKEMLTALDDSTVEVCAFFFLFFFLKGGCPCS